MTDEVKSVDPYLVESGDDIAGKAVQGRAIFNRAPWFHGMGSEPTSLEPTLQIGKVGRWTAERW
jgi:hypothetical protein